jgi:hypothetical protein
LEVEARAEEVELQEAKAKLEQFGKRRFQSAEEVEAAKKRRRLAEWNAGYYGEGFGFPELRQL